jgi:hypothetical protein
LGKDQKEEKEFMASSQLCKKCEYQQQVKEKKKWETKKYLRIDKRQTIFDLREIDYINEHQSRLYISFVDINSYLFYGIRTHTTKLTAAHCLHSMFNIFHKDFLLIWVHFLPGMFMLW